MVLQKIRGKLNIKTIWIWTYFIVIIVMCIVFFVGLGLIRETVERDARKDTYDNAVFMKHSLDDVWNSAYQSSFQMIKNDTALFLDSNINYDRWSAQGYYLSQDIRNYLDSNKMIEEIYLYYPKKDYIIGKRGVLPSHTYWVAEFLTNNSYPYEEWVNDLFGRRQVGYQTIIQNGVPELYYRIATPDITGRILVARINRDNLESTLSWISADNDQSFLAMVDKDDQVYACTGNVEKFVAPDNRVLNRGNLNSTIYTFLDSDTMNMQYMMATEYADAMKTTNAVFRVAVFILILSVIVGIIALFLIVKRNARPIERIAEKLVRGDSLTGNELQIIDEKIDGLIEENQSYIDKYRHNQDILVRKSFMNDSLRFGQIIQRDIEIIASFYTLTFDFDNYVVVIRERFGNDNSGSIHTFLESYNDNNSSISWTQKQDLDIFLLNYDSEESGSFEDGSADAREYLINMLSKNLSSDNSRIVCSERFENLEGLRRGYLECLRELGRKEIALMTVRKDSPVKSFSTMERSSSLGLFQNYLLDEDYQNARKILSEVIDAENESPINSADKFYIIMWLGVNKKIPVEKISTLDSENTNKGFYSKVSAILEYMIENRTDEKLSIDENDIAGKARTIIDTSYENPLLGLCMVSEELGISQSYVSRVFKKKYGIGLSHYINQVRIIHAKDLLKKETLNIKEIALLTGFSSDIMLIRVFKKIEGITPGMYRDHFREEI